MNRSFSNKLLALAALAVILFNVTDSFNRQRHRTLVQRRSEVLKQQRHQIVELLNSGNESLSLSKTLSTAAHSYCDGHDLTEYPLPNYSDCPPDSILNVIPFIGGMTTGLKLVMLGALMSFQENRCFIISDRHSSLNHESSSFVNEFFEGIGLSQRHPSVQRAMAEGRYEVRNWKQWWGNYILRRLKGAKYNYQTYAYSHPEYGVDGLELKRDFLRHMWHLRPSYRDLTCQALKDEEIFDTDYIALSIRRGDVDKESDSFKTMEEYIVEAERLVPLIFDKGQTPKIFVATDDCGLVDTIRKNRPHWNIKSQCDQLSFVQNGYTEDKLEALTREQRDEHFRKFFVELYALAFSKVFIGVSHTNVAWFAYMMRPNVDRSTFILLDYINDPKEMMHDPVRIW